MKFSLNIDPNSDDTYVVVTARALDDDVLRLQRAIHVVETTTSQRLVGTQGHTASPLDLRRILRFYTQDKHVRAHTTNGDWQLRLRLKDLVELLPAEDFIQINQGELVNINYVQQMDMSPTATIGLTLKDGTHCFVSRRSLKAFREALGL